MSYAEEMEANTERHESYGTLTFGRSYGGAVPLFGSDVLHNAVITLEIHEARDTRHLHRNWISGEKLLLRAEMSTTQFADAITGVNGGSGTPITIKLVRGDEAFREAPPMPKTHKAFEKELHGKIEDVIGLIDEILDDSKLQVRQRRKIEGIKTHLLHNWPFLHEQYVEAMERATSEAKSTVESFISGKLQELGLEGLQNQLSLIPSIEENDVEE